MQFLLGTAALNLLRADPRSGRRPWAEMAARLGDETDENGKLKLVESVLEEVRRHDPPVMIVERFAENGAVLDGFKEFQQDLPVFAMVASANRDGDESLEEFHWDRYLNASPVPHLGRNNEMAHLSMGHGLHDCIGRWLQSQVAPRALLAIVEAMPDLALCDEAAVPAWFDNIYFRGLDSLPVKRTKL